MSTRIEAHVSTQLNPFGPDWKSVQTGQVPDIGQQVQQALFGRPKPPVLDPANFPELAAAIAGLNKYKKKFALLAGDDESEYTIVLADGTIAAIDDAGIIYIGADFLAAHLGKPEVILGALAHEIGHRPKRWKNYKTRRQMSKEELDALCREEETRADIFAGKALAELELPCEPLTEFLVRIEDKSKPHPDYFPAVVRAEVIREAHAGRTYRADARRKLFPEFDRHTAPKGHIRKL